MKLELIRENIFKLLENETKFNQGDTVTTQKDGDGIVLLAKHPYYSIQLNNTGVTKSYHFTNLNASEPIESEFGKYELDEITVNKPIQKIFNLKNFESDELENLNQNDYIINLDGNKEKIKLKLKNIIRTEEGNLYDLTKIYNKRKLKSLGEIIVNKPFQKYKIQCYRNSFPYTEPIEIDGSIEIAKQKTIEKLNKDGNYNPRMPPNEFWAVIYLLDPKENRGEKEVGRVKMIDGKYQFYQLPNNLNESPSDKIVKLDGILTVDEDQFLIDILSDIRSLTGITTVRNIDIENEDLKTKLNIKIDPYPFNNQVEAKIQSFLIKKIKQIPGVKDFHKIKHVEKLSSNQKLRLPSSSPIPVSSIEDLQEIKINNPTRLKLIPGNYYDVLKARGKQAIKEYNKFPRFCSLEEINGEKVLWELGYKYKGIETIEFDTGTDTFHQFVEPWDGDELGWGIEDVKRWIDNNLMRKGSKQEHSMN